MNTTNSQPIIAGHETWVKLTHWVGTISFFLLLFSGVEILMVHPRFYWGETGNDLMPALFELPVSRNYQHGGWTTKEAFFDTKNAPVSAGRTYDIFNQNGWGRSLHFVSAWALLITGLIYLITALYTKHIQRHILPRKNELNYTTFKADIDNHLRSAIHFIKGPQYGLLQKISYTAVTFFLFPLMVLTGVTMSPAVTASCPFLLSLFNGIQSARTIHFFAAVLLLLFVIIHIIMIVRSGFTKQMMAMTLEA